MMCQLCIMDLSEVIAVQSGLFLVDSPTVISTLSELLSLIDMLI